MRPLQRAKVLGGTTAGVHGAWNNRPASPVSEATNRRRSISRNDATLASARRVLSPWKRGHPKQDAVAGE